MKREGKMRAKSHGVQDEGEVTWRARVVVQSYIVMELKRNMKRKSEVPLKVKLETKVDARMGVFQTLHVRVTILCDGVITSLPNYEKSMSTSIENRMCEVGVRFKVCK
ncbi:unnamed protein product [Sphenostylis stenocarpa]|uniref:Uncharacterized protein n=1 Tax=Sphenostylis stenocarpa TaxID=92480 RepID=A0AA86VZJ6_9FABA|nr:unnamed protein product [Sphenostylis stenocarpa]